METLTELRASHRRCAQHIKTLLILALLPAAFSISLLLAYHGQGAGLWMVTGLCFAHAMILWGAHRMHLVTGGRAPWATRMVEATNRWFPYLVLMVQGGVATTFGLLAWFTMADLGYAGSNFQLVSLLVLLSVWPIRRCIGYAGVQRTRSGPGFVYLGLHLLQRIAATLLIAESLALALDPGGPRLEGEFPMADVLVWVPAILVSLILLILFIDEITRKAKEEARDQERDRL